MDNSNLLSETMIDILKVIYKGVSSDNEKLLTFEAKIGFDEQMRVIKVSNVKLNNEQKVVNFALIMKMNEFSTKLLELPKDKRPVGCAFSVGPDGSFSLNPEYA